MRAMRQQEIDGHDFAWADPVRLDFVE